MLKKCAECNKEFKIGFEPGITLIQFCKECQETKSVAKKKKK